MAYAATKSYGYPGSMPTDAYSRASVFFGSDYAVGGPNDLVTRVGAGDRVVTVTGGTAYGKGIMDTLPAGQIALPAVNVGTRWFAIVVRRNWGTLTGTTTVDFREGDSFDRLPNLDKLSDGMLLDDQPIALAQVVAGQTQVARIIDLRSFPSKVAVLADLRAWPDAPIGARAIITGTGVEYRRDLDRNGSPVWVLTAARTWRGQIWDGIADGYFNAASQRLVAPPIRQGTGELGRATTMTPGPSWVGGGKVLTPPAPGTYRLVWHPRWVRATQPDRLAYAQIRLNPTNDPQAGWEVGGVFDPGFGARIAEDPSPMNAGAPRAEVEFEFGPSDRFLLLTWHDADRADLNVYNLHSWFTMTRIS